jgi:hypothetical protein
MGWALFYMMVILKIPILALGYIVYKAVKDVPEPMAGDDGGTKVRGPRHPHRPSRPRHPRLPRRGGPHALVPPAPPQRIRAHAKRIQRTHG